jgi:hypothetical protein
VGDYSHSALSRFLIIGHGAKQGNKGIIAGLNLGMGRLNVLRNQLRFAWSSNGTWVLFLRAPNSSPPIKNLCFLAYTESSFVH